MSNSEDSIGIDYPENELFDDSTPSVSSNATSSEPRKTDSFQKSERSKSTSYEPEFSEDSPDGSSGSRGRTKTFLETCAIAEDLGNEKYPQLAKLQFLEVLARDHYERPLVVIYGCRLPVLRSSNQPEVVSYIKETLDLLVENEYDAIYFHYSSNMSAMSQMSALRKSYGEFDRKYKKNIKTLYVVHPNRTMMVLYNMFKGFISKKFERKLRLVKNLHELESVVNLELMHIPMSIKSYDSGRNAWSEFGKEFSQVSLDSRGVPYLFTEAVDYLRRTKATSEVTGLFRVSGSGNNQKSLAKKYSISPETFQIPEKTNAHDVTGLVKQFLNQLPTPILYFGVLKLPNYEDDTIEDYIVNNLDDNAKASLLVLFELFEEIISNKAKNSMSEDNLMRCTALSLAWSETADMNDLQKMESVFYVLLKKYQTILV